MAHPARSAGVWLDGWLQRLAEQGFSLGPRERLQVQTLLARVAADGELAADPAAMLALAGPLVCGTREQQRRYTRLLDSYVAEMRRPRAAAADPDLPDEAARAAQAAEAHAARHRRLLRRLGAALVLLTVLLVWRVLVSGEAGNRTRAASQAASSGAVAGSAAVPVPVPVPTAPEPSWQVLPQPLPEPLLKAPPWSAPLRAGLVTASGAAALLLLALAWRQQRRRMALQGTRSDAAVQHHLLYDPAPVSMAPHPVLVRAVGRSLRQRTAGDAQVLDLPGTLAATVAAHGALSPRWRAMQRMPEYLVLIDRRHAADHQAAYAEALVDALFRAGVALHVYHFDASPAAGCWARGALGNADPLTRRRVSLAELAARSQGLRLLAFGAADAFINPATGAAQPWTSALAGFGQRAWFTARPMADWGAAEEAADAAGFLVLPLQQAALQTLAGWLTAERLTLALDPDTPAALPDELRQAGLNWVVADAPPPEVQQRVLQQLRLWLGGVRFQWLCACAIFPAVTPPLTLALGRHVVGEGRALALGLVALSALPWFRWGRMPAWLRESLLEQLSATHREQLQAVVQQRLSDALGRGSGPALADVATRVNAWLRRGGGAAQDLLLAEYLAQKDRLSRLAQWLPEALRRRLFRDGRGERGLRAWLLAGPAAVALAGAVALTPAWQQLVPMQAESALPLLASLKLGSAPAAAVSDIAFVSEQTVRVRYADGTVRMAYLADGPQRRSLEMPAEAGPALRAFADQHARVAPLARPDGGARVEVVPRSGAVLVHYVRHEPPATVSLRLRPGQRARAAAFTPSGSRVVAITDDGELRVWGLPRIEFDVIVCNDAAASQWLRPEDLDAVAPAARAAGIEFERLSEAVWRGLSGPELPSVGEVRMGGVVGDTSAKALSVLVESLVARTPGLGAVPLRRVPDAAVAAVASSCARQAEPQPTAPDETVAAIMGLSAQQVQALTRRVDRLFGNDKDDRVAATRELLADGDAFSDAITLALPRALRITQPSRLPMTDARASGVVNTLVLLQQALPATLNSHRAQIEQLLAGVPRIGGETQKQAEPVAARLKAAAGRRPLLYVQIASEMQRAPAQALLAELPAARFNVQPMELRTKEAPSRPELRIVGLSDRATARPWALAKSLPMLGIRPRAKAPPDNDTYEVWLDAAWCVTRTAPACPVLAVAAPVAAPPPASAAAAESAAALQASAPASAPQPAVVQNGFRAELFACPSNTGSKPGSSKGTSPQSTLERRVRGVLTGMGITARAGLELKGSALKSTAPVVVASYPANEAAVESIARELRQAGLTVETQLIDIDAISLSAEAVEASSVGFKLVGPQPRALVLLCAAR